MSEPSRCLTEVAVSEGNIGLLSLLLRKNPDRVHWKFAGKTLLMHAVFYRRADVVQWLLEEVSYDTQIHAEDLCSPLAFACKFEFPEVVKMLLLHGHPSLINQLERREADPQFESLTPLACTIDRTFFDLATMIVTHEHTHWDLLPEHQDQLWNKIMSKEPAEGEGLLAFDTLFYAITVKISVSNHRMARLPARLQKVAAEAIMIREQANRYSELRTEHVRGGIESMPSVLVDIIVSYTELTHQDLCCQATRADFNITSGTTWDL
jgi:hypothetical protein